MHWTYDARTGVAYLALYGRGSVPTVVMSRPIAAGSRPGADAEIMLDFDKDSRLVGIEFLRSEEQLLAAVLEEVIGGGPD